MAVQSVTLQLPSPLYERLKRQAEQTNRSVEDELLEVIATAVPVADDVPANLAEAVSPLALLDDEALWRAARGHFPEEAAAQLEQLHLKRQREGLTASEAEARAGLVRQYEQTMLVRAQAAALLKQRGYDVSELLAGA
jgi:plasmid stability protein